MPRWEAHAAERLTLAALELFATRGYDSTTVADIADRAGVTSRTFFRHFPDKREVLFGGAGELRDRIGCALRDVPEDAPALVATLQAMSSCEDLFHLRAHEYLRERDAVISGSQELQEREARKLASIAAVVASGLVARGSDPDSARLVADLAMVVFTRAARLWMEDPATRYAVVVGRAAAQAQAVFSAESFSSESFSAESFRTERDPAAVP